MRRLRLSQKEKQIIAEVELDAQRTSQSVAKVLRIRDYTVQLTLRGLKERGVIKLKPFVDVSRLGKLNIAVYFATALTKQNLQATFLKQVIKCPQVAFFQSLAGDYNFVAVLHLNRLNDIQTFIRNLSMWSNGSIVLKSIIPRVGYQQYRRKYLTAPSKDEKSLTALTAVEAITLSSDEIALLSYLSSDSVESIRQAARELRLPYSTVDHRYQQLLQKKVIVGWFYDIKEDFLDVQRFKLLISCKQINVQFETRIEHFARTHPNIIYILYTLGEWDFELGVECSHAVDVMHIIESLYESFGTELSAIRSVTELSTLKFTMFPEPPRLIE